MDVSAESANESFIRERIRVMETRHLGHLGGLGVAVLEIQ
jgi:hypothetical protein